MILQLFDPLSKTSHDIMDMTGFDANRDGPRLLAALQKVLGPQELNCHYCSKPGWSVITPHGSYYHHECFLEHVRGCRSCAISIAMEK